MTDGIPSGTVEVNCGDLVGPALDWAVAKVEGIAVHIGDQDLGEKLRVFVVRGGCLPTVVGYMPSTEWRFGGPLIDKHLMDFTVEHPKTIGAALCDENGMYIGDRAVFGPTHLIAACRAIVAAHLGEVVSVPAELVENKSPG
jgi:hypothetical protein